VDEPIVFISHFRLAPGARPALAEAFAGAVGLIGETKPRTALYAAYLDDAGRDLRIVHAFPDAASMATHFEGAADRANAVATIIAPAGFEVYGNAPPTATEQLRREAHAAGVRLDLFADPLGGFLRDVRPATGAAG
jgi:hypothetical protein